MNRQVIIDTDVLVDFEHNKAPWLNDIFTGKSKIIPVLPTIVISEYWASQKFNSTQTQGVANELLSQFTKQEFSESIAKVMGSIMRHKSYPSGASISDLIVASTAIHLNAPLATRNKQHYSGVPNLSFFEP